MSDPDDALGERLRLRLERAGSRLRAAEGERRAALIELHEAVIEADGNLTASIASELTGLPTDILLTIQPDLLRDPE